jgi:processing peptidase subunit beta
VTVLSNGLRVASSRTADETLTVGVWIDAGSRFETKENNGTAHFLEHMAFKGTRRRSRIQLEQEIENMGGHLNAYTSREQTVYYAKCFKDDLRQGVDILADILQNSTLDQSSLDFERGVILREMEEVEKTTEEVIFDRLHLAAFHESPLGYTILGPVENIQSITRQQLREYILRNYTADRMVVAAAGPVDHAELVNHADELFGGFKRSVTTPPKEARPKFCGYELLYRTNEEAGGLAHLAVGYEGVPWTHPDSITFMVMQSIIGNYKRGEGLVPPKLSGNRLTNSIANNLEPGMAESFAAFNTCYKDTGLFGFYAQAEESGVEATIDELLLGVTGLAHTVTEEETERGKRQLKTLLFGSLDSTTAVAEDIGRQLLVYGRRIPINELSMRIDAVDATEVRRVAKRYLCDVDIAVTALGPLDRMPPISTLRARTSASRC